jgi:hypothetical protein
LELRTNRAFSSVQKQCTPDGSISVGEEQDQLLVYEGFVQNGWCDVSFQLLPGGTEIYFDLKLDIDGNGSLDQAPNFVYLRAAKVSPPVSPFLLIVPKGWDLNVPFTPTVNFRIFKLLYLVGGWGQKVVEYITDIETLERGG